ncbi:MAG TPA: SRPBCC domain-containing protein, partial [Myxococcota bacterium]
FEFHLKHPPKKVWKALTDPELLAEWLLPAIGFRLENGAPFTFQTQAYPGWDGTVSCRMLAIEPLKKLSYTWTVPMMDTVVTFELAERDGGTLLTLVQAGFKAEQKQNFGGARYGWTMMGEKLIAVLDRLA